MKSQSHLLICLVDGELDSFSLFFPFFSYAGNLEMLMYNNLEVI